MPRHGLVTPGVHVFIAGVTGSGKSHWLRPELEQGSYHLIVWDPENEYAPGLEYRTPYGAMQHILRCVEAGVRGVATVCMGHAKPEKKGQAVGDLAEFAHQLGEDGHPIVLVVEEARFACKREYLDPRTVQLATEGRKRRASLVLVSQYMTRAVDRDLMGMCTRWLVFRLLDFQCLEEVRKKFGPEVRDRVRSLQRGEAIVYPDDIDGAYAPSHPSPPLPEDKSCNEGPPRVPLEDEDPQAEVGEGSYPGAEGDREHEEQ